MFKAFFVTLTLTCSFATQAASFDCSKADSDIEKMICKNLELSAADETLAKRYGEVKGKAQRPDLLRKNQLEWLAQRNACSSEACVLNEYKTQIDFIESWFVYEEKTLPKPGGEVQCTDRPECWPEGSAMHTGLMLAEKQQEISKQMEARHAALIDLLSSSPDHSGGANPDARTISALKNLQTVWDQYVNEECELVGSLTGGGGSWPSTYATECKHNLMKERLLQINAAIKCVEKIPVKDRWMDQSACLEPLAPLANKL